MEGMSRQQIWSQGRASSRRKRTGHKGSRSRHSHVGEELVQRDSYKHGSHLSIILLPVVTLFLGVLVATFITCFFHYGDGFRSVHKPDFLNDEPEHDAQEWIKNSKHFEVVTYQE